MVEAKNGNNDQISEIKNKRRVGGKITLSLAIDSMPFSDRSSFGSTCACGYQHGGVAGLTAMGGYRPIKATCFPLPGNRAVYPAHAVL